MKEHKGTSDMHVGDWPDTDKFGVSVSGAYFVPGWC